MQQFLVKLMFNIHIENGKNTSQFDEQIRMVESQSFENAFQKARSLGKKEETTFLNHENKLVTWKFIDVVELFPLGDFKDGEQLYSNSHDEQDAASYINYIRQKSMLIQTKSLTFA